MSQCHDQYRWAGAGEAPGPVPDVDGAQCHDHRPWDVESAVMEETPAGGPVSVLLAESDEAARSSILQALESDSRILAVQAVASGDEAISGSSDVDVVVVDLRSVRGLGALGTIRRIAAGDGHPAIVAVDRDGVDWLDRAALVEGAADVVAWPSEQLHIAERLVRVMASNLR